MKSALIRVMSYVFTCSILCLWWMDTAKTQPDNMKIFYAAGMIIGVIMVTAIYVVRSREDHDGDR